jgi:hypothetical protein
MVPKRPLAITDILAGHPLPYQHTMCKIEEKLSSS